MDAYYTDDTVTLYHGHATKVAEALESSSVQTIVTSPPYFNLRDYGEAGQIGLESTLEEYVDSLVLLFDELRRVLADDGTLWLNLGDSFSGSGKGCMKDGTYRVEPGGKQVTNRGSASGVLHRTKNLLPPKNLMGVPWRVAFALQDAGWILRSDIIWAKPNPMPESVSDRPTRAHEYVFLFSKNPKYFYNAEAIAEPVKDVSVARLAQGTEHQSSSMRVTGRDTPMKAVGPKFGGGKKNGGATYSGNEYVSTGLANKRDVWMIPTAAFKAAHFAVYPQDLVRPCVLAGSRIGDTVLDPFSGSGTTGEVATQLGRKYVGIDLNSEYLDLSLRERFAQPALNFYGG